MAGMAVDPNENQIEIPPKAEAYLLKRKN